MHKFRLCTWLLVPALIGGAGPLHGQTRKQRPLAPNPSAFVAADIGFSRLAQDKGPAAAVREYGEAQAQMMTPESGAQPVLARDWSKGAQAGVRLTPLAVVLSCDGNMAVTQGRWADGHAAGPYVSVWIRDEKGRLKWRLHQRGTAEASDSVLSAAKPASASVGASAADDDDDGADVGFVRTQQAVCQPRAAKADVALPGNWSMDDSLSWMLEPMAQGKVGLRVTLWNGKNMATVIAPTAELAQQ